MAYSSYMEHFDGHLHIMKKTGDFSPLYKRLKDSAMDGGIILSLPPDSFGKSDHNLSPEERVKNLISCTTGGNNLYPFFWIDPLEKNAQDQVDMALDSGVMGFKVICNHFYPGDPRAMEIFRYIAQKEKPILFHSGILWDGGVSSKYNRPVEFEELINVEGLRFSLAHISWPWCDEHIALYGKILAADKRGIEMFVDTTPGTPPIYRREALEKLYTVGYPVEHNIFFGSDNLAGDYKVSWVREWVKRDRAIIEEVLIKSVYTGDASKVLQQYFAGNLKRFVGA
jgi:predicted TIM-barrel fold metal-dependent hydrolase